VQVTTPEIVFAGGLAANETEFTYQPLLPLGDPGLREMVGAPGPVVSRFTEKVTLAVFPALSIAVQLTVYIP